MRFFKILLYDFNLIISSIYYSLYKRDKDLWVFGEWLGEKCCDNCLYFANYISETYPNIKLVWLSKEGTDLTLLNNRIETVIIDSSVAKTYLRRAGVVLMVHGMSDLTFSDKVYYSGALAVNLWHGIPWKKIHLDTNYNFFVKLHKLLQTKLCDGNVFLSTSDCFNNIINSAFYCSNRNIINSGYPRNSIFYDNKRIEMCRIKILEYMSSHGVNTKTDVRIITYMPTFRDRTDKVFSFQELINDLAFQRILDDNNILLIEKNHFVTSHRSNFGTNFSSHYAKIDNISSQELLAATDILVTDYSSCFFDYLLMDKPIIHYLYDYSYYSNNDRGLYYTKDEAACGDVVYDKEELIQSILDNLNNPEKDNKLREKQIKKFLQYENIKSSCTIFNNINSRVNEKFK